MLLAIHKPWLLAARYLHVAFQTASETQDGLSQIALSHRLVMHLCAYFRHLEEVCQTLSKQSRPECPGDV